MRHLKGRVLVVLIPLLYFLFIPLSNGEEPEKKAENHEKKTVTSRVLGEPIIFKEDLQNENQRHGDELGETSAEESGKDRKESGQAGEPKQSKSSTSKSKESQVSRDSREESRQKEVKKKEPSNSGGNIKSHMTDTRGVNQGIADKYMLLINSNAKVNGLEPKLIAAVIDVESKFDRNATSSVGAIGLMQIMPSNADWMGVTVGQLRNPSVNVREGSAYLAKLINEFGYKKGIIAYNQGEGNVRRGTYKTWYYSKVMSSYNQISR